MASTVSEHPAAKSYDDPRLSRRTIPGTGNIALTTMTVALPLYLDLARRLNRKVAPLSKRDTWSISIRPPAAGDPDAISDHAGWACDFWSSGIGAHTWPPRMSAKQARIMRRIVHSYKTSDGRRIFGWGAHSSLGGDYDQPRNNDPMHVFVRPGITPDDLRAVRAAMGISKGGRRRARFGTVRFRLTSAAYRVPGAQNTRRPKRKRRRGTTMRVAAWQRVGRRDWIRDVRGDWFRARRTDWVRPGK